jgi:hypothetical protein
MGEYQWTNRIKNKHNVYKMVDRKQYLFFGDSGKWNVCENRNGSSCSLINPTGSNNPTSTGWKYFDNDKVQHEDSTLKVVFCNATSNFIDTLSLETTTLTTTMVSTTTATLESTSLAIEIPEEVTEVFNFRECIEPERKDTNEKEDNEQVIDIFFNPSEEMNRKVLMQNIQNKSEEYFRNADMSKLYPNLFKLLWYATLPCYELPLLSKDHHLVKSCQLAGNDLDCSKLFTKIPTDLGMCCSLNYEEAIKQSAYADLVQEMQSSSEFDIKDVANKTKVPAAVGIRNGLKLTLDLHSNSESLGSISNDFAAFRVLHWPSN